MTTLNEYRFIQKVMRTRVAWVVILVILKFSTSHAAVNILDNPGFESGTSNWMNLGSTTLTADTSDVHSGTNSCKVTNRLYTWAGVEQSLLGNVEKGTNLVGSAWVKLDNSASDTIRMQIKLTDDTGTHYIDLETRTIANTAWIQLSGTWEANWTGELTLLTVRVSGPAVNVNFYADDMFIGKRELITNPDFENGTLGWQALGCSIALDNSDYHSGNNSMAVSNRTATWNGVEQNIMGVLENGDVVEGSAWVKIDTGTNQTVYLSMKVTVNGVSTYPVIATKVINAADGWIQISGSYTLEYSGTLTNLSLRINGPSSPSFHIDDVYLKKIELIHNGSFENSTTSWNSQGNATCTVSTAQSYEGNSSIYVSNRDSFADGITQELLGVVQKGDVLNASAWFRVESGNDQLIRIMVAYTDDTGNKYGTFGETRVSSDGWYRVSGALTVNWTGTLTSYRLWLMGPSEYINFYADSVSVTRYQGPSGAPIWRSSLYPENWTPGYADNNGNFLHDFSYAGYHQGQRLLPDNPPGNIYDVTKAPYYANNQGTADATTAIQAAIDDAGAAGGGIVYLPAGTYSIEPTTGKDYALLIHNSRVVLRGAGTTQTYIFNNSTFMRLKSAIRVQPNIADWHSAVQGTTVYATENAMSPTHTISLTDSSGFTVGDWIVLRTDCTEEFIEEHEMADYWDPSMQQGITLLRKVTENNTLENTITVDIPTRYYMKTRDNFRVYKINPPIEEVGIEHLSIGMRQHPGTSGWGDEDYSDPENSAYDVHSSHLISYYNVANGWVRDVKTYRPTVNTNDYHVLSNVMLFDETQNITVADCLVEKSQYEGGGGNGYGYTLRGGDTLIVNCSAHHMRHNYDFKLMSATGNAIVRCTSIDPRLPSDYHMWLSTCNLFDSMIMEGDYLQARFRPDGTFPWGHGHTSSESVFWNTYGSATCPGRVVMSRQWNKGYVIGTKGPVHSVELGINDGTAPEDFLEGEGKADGLVPQSLYYDQLNRRLPLTSQLGTQLLVNGDFENGMTGWSSLGANISISTAVKHSGAASAYVTNRTATWNSIIQYITNSVEKGQRLEFTAWIRLDNVTSDSISMCLKRIDSSGSQYLSLDNATVTDDGWTQLHGEWIADWTGTLTELRLYFPNLSIGTNFYLDDVSVIVTGI